MAISTPPSPNNTNAQLFAYLYITDTTTHTYKTNGSSSFGSPNWGITMLQLGNIYPPLGAFSIFVNNTENQDVTVQPITNVAFSAGSTTSQFSDENLTASYTVTASDDDTHSFDFGTYPVEFVSANFTFATAPSSGYIVAYILPYRA